MNKLFVVFAALVLVLIIFVWYAALNSAEADDDSYFMDSATEMCLSTWYLRGLPTTKEMDNAENEEALYAMIKKSPHYPDCIEQFLHIEKAFRTRQLELFLKRSWK